jgi:hypothetical protein
MSTLIAFYNSEGLVGRCDAKCYQAHERDCLCICGGRNHGVGLFRALVNIQAHAQAWSELARRRGWHIDRADLGTAVLQPVLFEASSLPKAAVSSLLTGTVPVAEDGCSNRRGMPA